MKIYIWIRNILTAASVIVIIAAALCFILKLKPAVVMSGSMEPAFHVGSVAVVKRGAPFRIGDPIAFYWGSEYVTHRLTDITEENGTRYYITKGDSNETNDPQRLTIENIDGRVIFTIPVIGYVLYFASSAKGMIIMGSLMICLILSMFITGDEEAGRKGSQSI